MANPLQLVSANAAGQEGTITDGTGRVYGADSYNASISADGSLVEFYSDATNLGAPSVGQGEIYVKNLQTGAVTTVSADGDGTLFTGAQPDGAISENGSTVAFSGRDAASKVFAFGPTGMNEVFAKNLATGTLSVVSENAAGQAADRDAYNASVSADGNVVAYETKADNLSSLVAGPQDDYYNQVYARNQTTGVTSLASDTSAGVVGNSDSVVASVSGDGNIVTFVSSATNLVPGVPLVEGYDGGTVGADEIYQKNLATGALTLVSQTAGGALGDDVAGFDISASADGNEVAFIDGGNLNSVDNGFQHIVVKNVATGSLTTIDTGSSSTAIAQISPDGKFVTWDGNGETDADGHNLSYAYETNVATGVTTKLSQVAGTSFRDNNTTSYGYALTADDQTAVFATGASNPENQSPTVLPNTIGNSDVVAVSVPPAPTVAVTVDPTTSGFVNGTTPILSGFVSANATGVELFDGDPAGGGRNLGAAIVNGDGTWTFQRSIGAGDFSGIMAVATDASGQTGSAAAPYELVTAVTGTPYRAIEYDDAADGSYGYDAYGRTGAWLMDAANNGDGTHTIQAFDDGQQLHSAGNDTMTGNGSNESFVFFPTFGHDEVTDFRVAGAGHDTVDLTGTQLRTLAQVLRHTTMAGGDAVLHLYGNETVTLDGVTKAQLKAHGGDFRLA